MDGNKKKSRSLIMCTTPLQMLIAEKIIELNSDKEFDLLVLSSHDNDKYKHYYDRLKRICINSLAYVPESGLNSFIKFITELKKSYLNKKYEGLYLASIDSRYFQYLISKNKSSDIFTFDDGTANIIYSSLYYSNFKTKFLKRIVWRVMGVRVNMSDIKNISLLHYTIYEDIPNIINNTQLITLYKEKSSYLVQTDKIIKIYLGQNLAGISNTASNNDIANVIESLNIDYYYPHPKERRIPIGEFKLIESALVFEDYIIEYLKNNLDVRVEVYSFFSSAILNIANLDRVTVKYMYNSYLYNKYKDFYDLAENTFKVDCLNLDT